MALTDTDPFFDARLIAEDICIFCADVIQDKSFRNHPDAAHAAALAEQAGDLLSAFMEIACFRGIYFRLYWLHAVVPTPQVVPNMQGILPLLRRAWDLACEAEALRLKYFDDNP